MSMDQIAFALKEKGYAVTPDYLATPFVTSLRDDLADLRGAGRLKRAGLGPAKSIRDDIRRDEIFWLRENTPNPVQTDFFKRMDDLKRLMNEELLLGLRAYEFHYAHYPAGGFYAKHFDNFRENSARLISFALYLNPNWREAHGGKLRLHVPDGPVDIAPVAGTMVCFLSSEIEHEVLQSSVPRESVTGWFKTS